MDIIVYKHMQYCAQSITVIVYNSLLLYDKQVTMVNGCEFAELYTLSDASCYFFLNPSSNLPAAHLTFHERDLRMDGLDPVLICTFSEEAFHRL